MGITATKVKLERVKKGGVKKGRWTRLSNRVGVDNLQTSSFNSSSTKRNFSGTYEAMVEDTEKEKKLKLENEYKEQSDILASQLGSTEAVEQPRRVQ